MNTAIVCKGPGKEEAYYEGSNLTGENSTEKEGGDSGGDSMSMEAVKERQKRKTVDSERAQKARVIRKAIANHRKTQMEGGCRPNIHQPETT